MSLIFAQILNVENYKFLDKDPKMWSFIGDRRRPARQQKAIAQDPMEIGLLQ